MADLDVIDPTDRSDATVEAVARACTDLGFFRIPFSCVDENVREAAWGDAVAFFAEPASVKMAVAFPEAGYPYGYSPLAFERLAASNGSSEAVDLGDLKESYSVGPDALAPPTFESPTLEPPTLEPAPTEHCNSVHHPAQRWLRSPSMWATSPTRLRSSWSAYFRALTDVSVDLLSLMARGLELPDDFFVPFVDEAPSAMRALHYPELDRPPPEGALRAGAHTDYGTLTILRTDDVPGLEVQRPDGAWDAVTHEPDTFVVNLGDSIAQWTNDRWRSTVHRVTTVDPSPRQSLAFFHMANWDARIECLPTCVEDGADPIHDPVLAGPWLMSKFQRTVA